MRQITIHNVHKATKADIKAWIPFQIISDGEIIGVVSSPYDVHKLTPNVHKLTNDVRQASHDVNEPRLSPWDLKYGKKV